VKRLLSAIVAAAAVVLFTAAPASAAADTTCKVNGVKIIGTDIIGTSKADIIMCFHGVKKGTVLDGKGGADTITVYGDINGKTDGVANAGTIRGGGDGGSISVIGGAIPHGGGSCTGSAANAGKIVNSRGGEIYVEGGDVYGEKPCLHGDGGAGNTGVVKGSALDDRIEIRGGHGIDGDEGAGNTGTVDGREGSDVCTVTPPGGTVVNCE